ncbi:Lrp/AsnC family transcriptional regulator [Gluconobacter kondonii]|uniref:Lrp/AsnC family transcriptional regulator n=1 Tax=Gluconobacter kondonii TaxID=941463 RepID=UPI00197F74EA|nr:Lrp/AsnC family transcriptional regulator [Gluconobacter kondonii]MBN3867562.1 Lrp/AsnC family transcriptional regulator [Gluconobacter kondonii]MBS1053425.1 Lrp/AsnC family transcriptional regulator [Gluconobacter kondonii]MBS1057217.1 Lrp/AsnC family transcriptional regulator [Gluconobacter kondonii]MBS1066229.1 Lrp/AsnC family transcriptional regulator [Gluconobacter kondonii]MBS1077824.1 Lrp/AsnC family transcriptional regulator [Gluconobacter kondonii]
MTDSLDQALLDILRRNARTPTAALARRLGISRTTLQGRMERLERQGHIRGYTLMENTDDDLLRAHVSIVITPRHSQKVERDLKTLPELRELHAVSGASDLIALLGAATTEGINRAIDDIGQMEGVERTVSAIILSTRFRKGN